MGKTYRRAGDDDGHRKKPKNHNHSSGKKLGGMKIINDVWEGDEDFFDDQVSIQDKIVINRTSDDFA